MSRLLKAAIVAASSAGFLASAVPAVAAPAFDATYHVTEDRLNHSRDYGWRGRDRDRDRDDRYYGSRGYYREPVREESRAWRGRDGRYYCRKDDGTTGLLIGGAVGGLIGNEVAGRGDRTLGTILGVAGGALLGRAIDRSDSRCR